MALWSYLALKFYRNKKILCLVNSAMFLLDSDKKRFFRACM